MLCERTRVREELGAVKGRRLTLQRCLIHQSKILIESAVVERMDADQDERLVADVELLWLEGSERVRFWLLFCKGQNPSSRPN